jgi:hypothetical protein
MTSFTAEGANEPPKPNPGPATSVVYLLWAPLGPEIVQRFVDSYAQHPAGAEHRLVIAACGESADAPLEPLLAKFAALEHEVAHFDGPRIDLQTYFEVVGRDHSSQEFVFMNSYCRPLSGNWLKIFLDGLRTDGVGIVGAGGTYETIVRNMRWPLGLRYFWAFNGFPNPHVRTSCFAISRKSIGLIDWPEVRTKRDAWKFESGRKSITRQLAGEGLRALVVGRDGKRYEVDDWRQSETFRSGEQQNLLVADLRSDDYAQADAAERARLAKFAWGA